MNCGMEPLARTRFSTVEVVVVSVRLGLLRVDVLPEGGVQQRGLEVVRAEGVAGEQTVAVAVFDQLLHGGAGALVEGKGRAHDPENVPVLTLVAQQLDETVVVAGVGRLTAAPLAEGKLSPGWRPSPAQSRLRVGRIAVLAALGAADHDAVARA